MVPRYHGNAIIVEEDNLEGYLGKAPFDLDRFYKRTPVGVVMGMAWTSMGGSTLYVESNRVTSSRDSKSGPCLTTTGMV
jgi:ATP-dependent Lon protease